MVHKTETTNITADFSANYSHPKWQEKRLHIMQMDGFKCRRCSEKDKPLHVHHLKYKKGAKPWEYPDSNLVTLCESCHEEFHLMKQRIAERVNPLLELWITNKSRAMFDAEHLWQILISIEFLQPANSMWLYNLIKTSCSFAYFECENRALSRDELYPINCEDVK